MGWESMAAFKRREGMVKNCRRETDICSVTSQGKRNIRGGEGKINPDEFSKKSFGNLQGSNFSKKPVAEARLQGVSE